MPEPTLQQLAQAHSVQDLPDANNGALLSLFPFNGYLRGALLPPYATQERERKLRDYDRNDYVALWSGAVSGLCNRWSSTSYEIKGDEAIAPHFQNVAQNAQFGMGWSHLVKLIGRDYLRQDRGAFIEIIGAGDPNEPITGAVYGIAHLDSLRCYPTGDPEFPVIYFSREGKMHQMHYTRVYQLMDMPDGDELYPGYGRCALSRAITIVQRELLVNKYIELNLDDKPAPGIVVVKGVGQKEFEAAYQQYQQQQRANAAPDWGRQLFLFSLLSGDIAPEINVTQFATAPEKFDFQQYTEINVNALALALGVDKLDLWEITSSGLGSGAQSEVMASKSKGRTYGDFLAQLARFMNDIFPDGVDFEFKPQDAQDDKDTAAIAQAYAGVVQTLGDKLTADEARIYLANQVPSIADAITDAQGNVVRYNDALDRAQPHDALQGGSLTDTMHEVVNGAPQSLTDVMHNVTGSATALSDVMRRVVAKDYTATRAQFVDDFTAIVRNAPNESTLRVSLRAALARQGEQAYVDGLREGGVEDSLDDYDRLAIMVWLNDQNEFVSRFAREVANAQFSDEQIATRATMWANKSLDAIYQRALAIADTNGLYEWMLGKTEQHCKTCLALNGQRHRLKDYVNRGLMPRSSALDCGGWRCDCQLKRVKGSPRGRLPTAAKHLHTQQTVYATPRKLNALERLTTRERPSVTVMKGSDGLRYMFIVTSNSYIDREQEIITRKALTDYVDSCWKGDGIFASENVHLLWHKGAAIGDIVWADMRGKFLIEVSKERPDATVDLGDGYQASIRKVWDYLEANPDGMEWGASHGFVYSAGDKQKGAYTAIRKYETSTLPLESAANPFTFSGVLQ